MEMVDMDIVGEVHTHPESHKNAHLPSQMDIEEWIKHYESGEFPRDKPFVFGISARGEDKKNKLAFYRIVRDNQGKLIPKAFNEWEWVDKKQGKS